MADEIVKSNHNCTRLQLYSIFEMVINSGLENLAALFDYKAMYVTGLFTTFSGNRSAAMLLPGEEEIAFAHIEARLDLIDYKVICCKNYVFLKGYIKKAYPANRRAPMYVLAGSRLYPKAMNKNWDSVVGLNTLMKAFVADSGRLAALLAGDNMNTTFPAKITSDSGNFDVQHSILNSARQTYVPTSAKITADNLCYDNIVELCADAQIALDGFPELQKLFVFTTLLDMIAPPGSASFKLTAEMAVTFLKKEGLSVTIQQEGHPAITVITDIDGVAHFPGINPAKYAVTIVGEDVVTLEFIKDVDKGRNSHKEVTMEPSVILDEEEIDEDESDESAAIKEVEKPDATKEIVATKETEKVKEGKKPDELGKV
jgi:hypothetical protein